MNIVAVAESLQVELQEHASDERATNEKRYLKSNYTHLGVNVPNIRATARRFNRTHKEISHAELTNLTDLLWASNIYELRKLAVNILAGQTSKLKPTDIDLIKTLLGDSHTWALVDDISLNIAPPILDMHENPSVIRTTWSTDPNFWIRRAAMLSLLPKLRRPLRYHHYLKHQSTDTSQDTSRYSEGNNLDSDGVAAWHEFTTYADAMLHEKEFFIQKAIGWILREVSKHSPDLVTDWLTPRATRTSAVTMREALKYLPENQQNHLKKLRTTTPSLRT